MLPATPKETEPSSQLQDQRCRRFTLDEIRSAIQMLNEAAIGRGGFGEVFKGYLKDGPTSVVAIKRSNSTSNKVAPQFWAEVEMLSTLRHCNLVSLIGYCNEGIEMALVYEYMPNGTLKDHLYKNGAPLSWLQLLKICIGAAQGLEYLHTKSESKPPIIHRDVKTSNVLLDADFVAKISDFGIATRGPTNETSTHVSTEIKGTYGYFDPSYYGTGHLRTNSDVYAFGVVLLEVICGLPAVHKCNDGNSRGLATWAQGCIKQGKLSDIIDRRLSGQIASGCGKDFARIACDCLSETPQERPEMAAVVSRLQKVLALQERSPEREPKFIHKFVSCFRPNVESKGINLILVGGSESKPGDQLNNPIIVTGKSTAVLCDENAPDLNRYQSSGEGDAMIMARNDKFLPGHTSTTEGNLMVLSFKALQTATNYFHNDKFIGKGSFGSVFKGMIYEQSLAADKPGTGTTVAVVNQHLQSHPEEWLAAVNCLGLIDHPNLVKLIGYCTDDDHKLLVYEYMERGSLENYLFRRRFHTGPLAWNLRIKIALGVAKGLAYLHKPESTVMCHDINSTSILIDSNDNARISNFGMVKDGPVDSSGQVIHTKGYADPEYIKTGHFTKSSNIYSFGVVLLELLTGQRCIDKNGPEGERILVEFAKPYLTKDFKELEKIIDPHRDEHYSSGAAHRAALIAKKCLYEEPKCRSTADEIVEELGRLQLPLTNFSNA